jgi:hypothetical protein
MYVCSIEKASFGKGKGFFHATDLQMFFLEKKIEYLPFYISPYPLTSEKPSWLGKSHVYPSVY